MAPDPGRAELPAKRPGTLAAGGGGAGQRELRIGQVLKDKYRLEERIGRGGMGIVFRATDLEAERLGRGSARVAIKVLRLELQDRVDSLLIEVEKTRPMQQENIVDVYGFEQDKAAGVCFIVMEFLNGVPLDAFIAQSWADGMPYALAAPYIRAMAAALGYAHRHGVIHSDFKPSNVFVVAASAKVLDFGIARGARSGAQSIGGGERPVGFTRGFASCEMLDFQPADRRDDVFCFGLVVYFMLTGRHPFNGESATEARDARLKVPPIKSLTRRQNAALQHALHFDRFGRTATVEEVAEELEAGASGPSRALLRTALGGALAVAASLGYLYWERTYGLQDSDSQFLVEQCKDASPARTSDADLKLVGALLQQGNAYLNSGMKPFNPALLSEGVSSALGAYRAVIAFGADNCDAGAQGELQVLNAYKKEARRLYAAGQYRRANEMTKIALRIWPGSIDMQQLQVKLAVRAPE